MIPSCGDSQEIWDLLSPPGATQVSQGTRPGLKIELRLVRLPSRGFLEMGGVFWDRF